MHLLPSYLYEGQCNNKKIKLIRNNKNDINNRKKKER